MVRNTQLQVQLLLLEVEQDAPPAGASQADAVLAVAALGGWVGGWACGWERLLAQVWAAGALEPACTCRSVA
jgi:hypothetical protein